MLNTLVTLITGSALVLAIPDEDYEAPVSEAVSAVQQRVDGLTGEQLVAELEPLYRSGDASAGELLGELYYFGLNSIERDPAKACAIFEQIASLRPDAAHNLATCYFTGDGGEQDYSRARQWYAHAAEGGWVMARCAYGNMLVRGEGGPVDPEPGLALCLSGAEAGHRDAQTDYGIYLLTGRGIERDPVKARQWLERAAAQDQANATFLLGQIHEKGDGVPLDRAEASEYFARAHALGRPDAAMAAGRAYLFSGYKKEGEDVFVSAALLEKADEWFAIAERSDPEAAQRNQARELREAIAALLREAAGNDE